MTYLARLFRVELAAQVALCGCAILFSGVVLALGLSSRAGIWCRHE